MYVGGWLLGQWDQTHVINFVAIGSYDSYIPTARDNGFKFNPPTHADMSSLHSSSLKSQIGMQLPKKKNIFHVFISFGTQFTKLGLSYQKANNLQIKLWMFKVRIVLDMFISRLDVIKNGPSTGANRKFVNGQFQENFNTIFMKKKKKTI